MMEIYLKKRGRLAFGLPLFVDFVLEKAFLKSLEL